ncbi:MAG: DUF177 domain-containing protein [Proteobacteria bacterium]|nr:DUF177 domain-containing protein [Pseudomonadota bacterium]
MKIRIADIPLEGKEIDFELDKDIINQRVRLVAEEAGPKTAKPFDYLFNENPKVKLRLEMDGSTVVVSGRLESGFSTQCCRCLEDAKTEINIPIEIILKPISGRIPAKEQEDDIKFGTYNGEEVECNNFCEDYLFLALPFTVYCSTTCKGLCPLCGTNLNAATCECKKEETGDPRMSIFRQLKIH